MEDDRTLSLALSGGGHRATAFCAGALLALADAGLNDRVVSISSVSGGSIANGVAMVGPDYGTSPGTVIADHFRPALRVIGTRGILLGGAPATRTYVRMLIAGGTLAGISFFALLAFAILHWWTSAVVAGLLLVLACVTEWKLVRQRSARTEAAIDKELLGAADTTLADVGSRDLRVHHVICTTELQTGNSLFLTSRGVYGHDFGGTARPPPLRLATAVQASASVPGAFAPRSIGLDTLGITGQGRVLLTDGGVYDNMADEWEYGYANRRSQFGDLADIQPAPADLLVVVNASGGWNVKNEIGPGSFREELAGLLRSQAVQYDVSTAHRRRALHAVFRHADAAGRGLDGVFVQITDSPYRVTELFARPEHERDELSTRAHEARAYLDDHEGYNGPEWQRWADDNSGVKTTLAPLGADVTARLVEHGYVLTAINLYVLDGLGTLDHPIDRHRLRGLCS